MGNAIEIQGLVKRFTGYQLGPLDLTVPTGTIYGYVGTNGSGKSLTLDLIMGMGKQEAGTISVFGMDNRRDEVAVKLEIGYVSPDLRYDAFGTIQMVANFVRSFFPNWDDAYCESLAKRLNLDWGKKISTLSFGQRIKLALLLALSHKPKLLLLDEPLAGLDPVSRDEIYTELLNTMRDEERTVLITSHHLEAIERFADHVGILDDGKLLEEGACSDLLARYCIIDCSSSNGAPADLPGIHVRRHDGDRYRLLANKDQSGYAMLAEHGFTNRTETPVTLEELFVALVKKGDT